MSQAPYGTGSEGDDPNADSDGHRVGIAIAQALEQRAIIEQAKGMLSVIYDIDGETAFDVLRWRSQTTNIKLRVLACQLIADFRSVASDSDPPSRSKYDALLLTAHERVPANPPG